jgi:hypothetical protein
VTENYIAVSGLWPVVKGDCDFAEGELADYNATYGG